MSIIGSTAGWRQAGPGGFTNTDPGRCLDVSENNPADGQQMHLWDCLGAANQKWVLPSNGARGWAAASR